MLRSGAFNCALFFQKTADYPDYPTGLPEKDLELGGLPKHQTCRITRISAKTLRITRIDLSGLPGLPTGTCDGLPGFTSDGLPGLPTLRGLPGLPNLFTSDGLPGLPTLCGLPGT